MATPLGRQIKSAYAFRKGIYHNWTPTERDATMPKNSPNIWIDFWYEEITVNNLTKSLSDSLTTGSGGSYTFS